ncbi:MAG: DUF4145 domain-containing protein [Firmicutes bacterium]|nr:DUF4145 domain-containing protein [Bacillota bacterium]
MYDRNLFKLQTCYHCGNQSLMPIVHKHAHDYGGPVFDEFDDMIDCEFEEHFDWFLLSCPVCNKITLYEEYENEVTRGQYTQSEVLYPQSSIDYSGVPENIKTAFESALKVKNIDTAICALSLRRVLEAICKDRGANGRNLEQMISDMISRQILPQMFDDACWIVRQLGNSAAHGDTKHFSKYQVDQTIIFMQNIINYLYTLPFKMQRLRAAIQDEDDIVL